MLNSMWCSKDIFLLFLQFSWVFGRFLCLRQKIINSENMFKNVQKGFDRKMANCQYFSYIVVKFGPFGGSRDLQLN